MAETKEEKRRKAREKELREIGMGFKDLWKQLQEGPEEPTQNLPNFMDELKSMGGLLTGADEQKERRDFAKEQGIELKSYGILPQSQTVNKVIADRARGDIAAQDQQKKDSLMQDNMDRFFAQADAIQEANAAKQDIPSSPAAGIGSSPQAKVAARNLLAQKQSDNTDLVSRVTAGTPFASEPTPTDTTKPPMLPTPDQEGDVAPTPSTRPEPKLRENQGFTAERKNEDGSTVKGVLVGNKSGRMIYDYSQEARDRDAAAKEAYAKRMKDPSTIPSYSTQPQYRATQQGTDSRTAAYMRQGAGAGTGMSRQQSEQDDEVKRRYFS